MTTRVLVVDDEQDTLNLLKLLLEISGFHPIATLNSLDAMTLAEIEKPDIALLDIMMPKLDGFALCKMIRDNPQTKHLPVIFVTAYNALDLEERRLEAGADFVLPKPINMDELLKAVTKIHDIRNNNHAGATPKPSLSTQTTEAKPLTPKPAADAPKVSPPPAAKSAQPIDDELDISITPDNGHAARDEKTDKPTDKGKDTH
ncbi:MAG: response regulator [Anaerolineales bacterium]|nr:response regulator [Anaerolineales bacterium]